MSHAFSVAGKPDPPRAGFHYPLPGQPRVLGSHRPLKQGGQFAAASAAICFGTLVTKGPQQHGRKLHRKSLGATGRTTEPLPAPSALDDVKAALRQGQSIEPSKFARIFSDHMSQTFNSHPLIDSLKEILSDLNNGQISEEERKEIEALLIVATREMGFGFPDLCTELWDKTFLGRISQMGNCAMSAFKQTYFYKLFSEHFREDKTHAFRFYWPAAILLLAISLSDYVRDTIKAQETDRPLIKVFRDSMRLGSNPWALCFIVEAIEKSGDSFFGITSKIWPKNPFLGIGHKEKEDGHAQGEAKHDTKFLQAFEWQETILRDLGFRKLRDPEAQLEAIEEGERTRDAMAEYLDGIHERLAGLRDIQRKRRSDALADSKVEKPQSDATVSSPTHEQVLIGVKFMNGVVGSLNIMTSVFEIELKELEGNPDSQAYMKIQDLLNKHKKLEAPIIALSELIGKCCPNLKDHPINECKFFTEYGNNERAKVLGALRDLANAKIENDAQYAAISKFYQLMIDELGDIKNQLNNDKSLESGELITKINQQIAEVINQIKEIKGTIEVSN